MSTVAFLLSPEQLAQQLEYAAGDALVDRELAAMSRPTATPDAVIALTDSVLGPRATTTAEIDYLGEATILKLNDIARDVRDWTEKIFRGTVDKTAALAGKIVEIAKNVGVSVEHVVSRLYRRVMRNLVESSILTPFTISDDEGKTVSVTPSEASFSYTAKVEPSLASVGLDGVISMLSGLFKLEMSVSVKYVASSS